MPLDFPPSPAVGQYYNGYIWDGTVWDSALQPSVPALLTTAPVYANESARTTAVPSPAEGQLSYLNDINQFQGYAGTSWRPLGGLAPAIPTTVAVSGGTASANSLGVISFSGATSISLNNVFTSTYKHYRIIFDCSASVSGTDLWFRLRSAGTDNSAANYYWGGVNGLASGTSSVWYGNSTTSLRISYLSSSTYNNFSLDIFNPQVNQKTNWNALASGSTVSSTFGVYFGGLHDVAAQYDGFTLYTGSGNFTGSVQVLGYNN